jgi:hypothetical protein
MTQTQHSLIRTIFRFRAALGLAIIAMVAAAAPVALRKAGFFRHRLNPELAKRRNTNTPAPENGQRPLAPFTATANPLNLPPDQWRSCPRARGRQTNARDRSHGKECEHG